MSCGECDILHEHEMCSGIKERTDENKVIARPSAVIMKICHLIPYIGYARGGPVISLSVLAGDLQKKYCQITIGSINKKSDGEKVAFGDDVEVVMYQRSFGGMYRWCPFLARELFSRDFDVVHSHGLWTYTIPLPDALHQKSSCLTFWPLVECLMRGH